MSKKKTQSARKEKNIEEKQKDLLHSTIMEGIGLSLVGFYAAASYAAYASLHPREDVGECISGVIQEALNNPLYFYPIDLSALPTILTVAFMLVLIVFMQYTINKLRIHHDINTLKGSAKWGDVHEYTRRMGDFIKS